MVCLTDAAERFVTDCKTCGYHEEYGLAVLASEDARDHRAQTWRPGAPRHEVASFPKSLWERGETALHASALHQEIALRPVHVERPDSGAYSAFKAFYDGLGFRLTPLHAPCAECREHPWATSDCRACRGGKKPLYQDWQKGAPLVAGANVGVVMGTASGGVIGVDFDEVDLMARRLRRTPAALADETLTVRSHRGHHLYLREEGVPNMTLERGIDVRGNGGLLVAPPSVHASGTMYEFVPGRAVANRWIAPARRILPPDLYAELLRKRHRASNTNTAPPAPAPAAAPAPRPSSRDAPTTIQPRKSSPAVDMREVVAWLAFAPPALREHWRVLRGERGPLPPEDGGRSKSDWVIALCLSELALGREPPWGAGEIAWVLMQQPGSKARERGEAYAMLTATKALNLKRRARGQDVATGAT